MQQALRQPGAGCGSRPRAEPCPFLPRAAVDEQNAQTQEQERIVLGLPELEEKKDLKSDDRLCHSEICGVAKHRSLRKGTARRPGCPSVLRPGRCGAQAARRAKFWVPFRDCSGHLAVEESGAHGLPVHHLPCAVCLTAGGVSGAAPLLRSALSPDPVGLRASGLQPVGHRARAAFAPLAGLAWRGDQGTTSPRAVCPGTLPLLAEPPAQAPHVEGRPLPLAVHGPSLAAQQDTERYICLRGHPMVTPTQNSAWPL